MKDTLFLCALDVHQVTAQPIYAFFEGGGLLRYLSWSGWCFTSRLTLNHNVEVNKLVGERAHIIFHAKCVFADCICSEDIVSLPLALTVEKNFVIRVLYFKINVE